MATAQEWIEAAYARSTANDPGKLAVDAELLGHLDRFYQRIYPLFAKARPDEAGTRGTWVMSGTPAAFTIPVETFAITSLHLASGGQVHLIPVHEKERRWHIAPAVMRVGAQLVSRAMTGDPVNGTSLSVVYLDPPAPLVALNATVDTRFPTRHHQLCVDALALYLDTKDAGRDPAGHQKLMASYQGGVAAFAAEYDLAPDAISWMSEKLERSAAIAGATK